MVQAVVVQEREERSIHCTAEQGHQVEEATRDTEGICGTRIASLGGLIAASCSMLHHLVH